MVPGNWVVCDKLKVFIFLAALPDLAHGLKWRCFWNVWGGRRVDCEVEPLVLCLVFRFIRVGGYKLLNSWLTYARTNNNSPLLHQILLTLQHLPLTVDHLKLVRNHKADSFMLPTVRVFCSCEWGSTCRTNRSIHMVGTDFPLQKCLQWIVTIH